MKARIFFFLLLWSIGLLAAGATPKSAASEQAAEAGPLWSWIAPDGKPVSFASEEEALDFLRTAKVVAKKRLSTGRNRTLKVRLEDEGVAANAVFRTVDLRWDRVKLSGRFYRDFHDSYLYECAAYRMSRLLGIDSVPPCVRRVLEGEPGTLQFWVENAMIEKDRREKGLDPPKGLRWARQRQLMRLFDALIFNIDRHLGNMLIDAQWKLWFIDHTRSFLPVKDTRTPTSGGPIIWCERGVWERLQALDRDQLRSHLKGLVTGPQIKALLVRRDKLVAHIRELIETKGEGAVLYDWSQQESGLGDEALAVLAGGEDIPEESEIPEEDPDV